ncbi:MAG TPA: 3,4-dihydroxyphenylacetate 2,3-dioxygenase [Anaerolineae bacterium]|nr:3,4-dihydroxyphenylacetate 2,3-dioxygenase [Anaerolineae bacterium]
MPSFNITRVGHAEIRVTDLGRARAFYVDALGLLEIDKDDEHLYLGGMEERDKYCLLLRKAESSGIGHLAFRVAGPDDLDKIARVYEENGLPTRWIEPNTLERGQGRALRVQDPSGLPFEFYHEMEQRERLLQRFELYRGAHVMRIDHFNCQAPNVQAAYDWWTKVMGFWCSEYTVSDDEPERLWAVWLHRKQNVHDLALMNGIGPRLHHVGMWLQDTNSVLRACDILASLGMVGSMERGPGRHGLSNAFFLYLRDPDLNRIELYTNDYIIPDPDFEPIKWKLSDPRRATFWGHWAPRSWFDEASLVEDIRTGQLLPTQEPLMAGRPEHVT